MMDAKAALLFLIEDTSLCTTVFSHTLLKKVTSSGNASTAMLEAVAWNIFLMCANVMWKYTFAVIHLDFSRPLFLFFQAFQNAIFVPHIALE